MIGGVLFSVNFDKSIWRKSHKAQCSCLEQKGKRKAGRKTDMSPIGDITIYESQLFRVYRRSHSCRPHS